MRIHQQSESQLILSGVPGSLGWMLWLVFVGLLLITSSILFGWKIWTETETRFVLVPSMIGILLGVASVWIGVAQLKERERLVLDKASRTGVYTSTSPFVVTERSTRFKLADIQCIQLSRPSPSEIIHPGVGGPTSEALSLTIAILKTKEPLESIVLDETQNHDVARVEHIAQTVADFLEIKLEKPDKAS